MGASWATGPGLRGGLALPTLIFLCGLGGRLNGGAGLEGMAPNQPSSPGSEGSSGGGDGGGKGARSTYRLPLEARLVSGDVS